MRPRHLRGPRALPLLLGACCALLACSGDDPAAPAAPEIRIEAGGAGEDTVAAFPVQALVFRVTGVGGNPVVGSRVDVTASNMQVAEVGGSFATSVSLETDAQGRGYVQTRYGIVAGEEGGVRLEVGHLGIAEEATYTIRPGNPVFLYLWPIDTAVVMGDAWSGRIEVWDQFGNGRADPVEVTVEGEALGQAGGRIVGGRVGTGRIHARAEPVEGGPPLERIASVTVVPPGVIAVVPRGQGVHFGDLTGDWAALGTGPARFPTWSPDGSSIAFASETDLFVVDLDGSVSLLDLPEVEYPLWPRFGPEGEWIYFEAELANRVGPRRIFRARRDGTALDTLTDRFRHRRSPDPSPDGRSLLYNRGDFELVVQELETGEERLVLEANAWSPVWSPDGRWIAYAEESHTRRIMLVRPDGTELHPAAEGAFYNMTGLTWSPDGRWLLGFRQSGSDQGAVLVEVETGAHHVLPWGAYRELGFGIDWRPN